MRTLTLIDFQRDPHLRVALEHAARHERARRMAALLGRALANLFAGNHHAARPHLARQG